MAMQQAALRPQGSAFTHTWAVPLSLEMRLLSKETKEKEIADAQPSCNMCREPQCSLFYCSVYVPLSASYCIPPTLGCSSTKAGAIFFSVLNPQPTQCLVP